MRLGPYEIMARLGAGGMGEVWRARDTRLEREVAVKILPAEFAENARVRLRFEREAKTISQLNHPHICTLHDVGHEDGIDYLVMELIDGESLADRLARGPVPIAEALTYAAQIAEALDRAHRSGIVHRDLKPGNVMITRAGAKLLDFGLAKPGETASDAQAAADEATRHRPLTQEGTIVGTFQYMAPEQLEGMEADARTDIFALGAVIYEMVTGRRAFAGKTRTSLIAAIVSAEPPPLSEIRPLTPASLDHVVHRCLRKDPDQRWQSARDVAEELKWIAAAGSQAGSAPAIQRAGRRIVRPSFILVGVLLAALAVSGVMHMRLREEADRAGAVLRFALRPPAGTVVGFGGTLSPDGRSMLWSGATEGEWQVWRHSFDDGESHPVPGTEGGFAPFWSPDQTAFGFVRERKLKVISATGGAATVIAEGAVSRGASWSGDGRIVYVPSIGGPLHVVSANGGATRPAITLDAAVQERDQRWPSFLPDGKHFLYSSRGLRSAIYVASLEDGSRKKLIDAGSRGVYADGYLLFVRDKVLFAQPFDPGKLELSGEAVPITQGTREFSVSGRMLASWQGTGDAYELTWFDRTGKPLGTIGEASAWDHPRISRDGKRAAVDRVQDSGSSDIWVFDLSRGTMSRLTAGEGQEWIPVWSPDSTKIAFQAATGTDKQELHLTQANGAGGETVFVRSADRQHHSDWSADGRRVVQERSSPKTKTDLWIADVQSGEARPLVRSTFEERLPRISPDGRWLSYASDETGRFEVYLTDLHRSGTKWQVSSEGGAGSAWRHDGRELIFIGNRGMMAVEIRGTTEPEIGTPRMLFEVTPANDHAFDVAPDGRLLIPVVSESLRSAPFEVVANWQRLLEKQ